MSSSSSPSARSPPLPDQQARIFLSPQFFERFVGQLPRIPLDADDEFLPDALESLPRIVVVEADTGGQQRCDVLNQAACEFFQHALLGGSARDGFSFKRQVVVKAGDKLVAIHGELVETVVQIEEIAVLAPLQ